MSELEEKLNQVLSDPNTLQQIMALAQSMGAASPQQPPAPTPAPPEADLGMMKQVASLASGTTVDANQRALLRALSPYVSRDRVGKLEKAMRAAKMAAFASTLLQQQSRR